MKKRKHVFISYKREQQEIASAVRLALKASGFKVWWDEELQAGGKWDQKIDEALMNAQAIVVLWSEKSVMSEWVRHEASTGKIQGILTHARIDETVIPEPFQSIQEVNLTGWNYREDAPEFMKLVRAIKSTSKHNTLVALRNFFIKYTIPFLLFVYLIIENTSMKRELSKEAGATIESSQGKVIAENRGIKNESIFKYIRERESEEVRRLLIEGVDPNTLRYGGRTPLHLASSMGNYNALMLLLDYGADPNLSDHKGSTPFMEAVQKGQMTLIQHLIKVNKKRKCAYLNNLKQS